MPGEATETFAVVSGCMPLGRGNDKVKRDVAGEI